GDLRPRYSYKLTDWRDRTIFNTAAANIDRVEVAYQDYPQESFAIVDSSGTKSIIAPKMATISKDSTYHKKINAYLHFFENINCEGYLNGQVGMDTTIKNARKFVTITLTTKDKTTQTAHIYWMLLNKRSKNRAIPHEGIPTDYDADRLYAVLEPTHDTALIQMQTFEKLFKRCSDFGAQQRR
ncbi:MAG: hypothetical protein EBX41_03515, partial [Chitinophagia bacterium]|nr:hypothetical protein [Chitinophagia bacterium]